jgi:3-deoxy-manno-octulosonate cytidylyltransferase (CMP-KDO synthetase)
VLLFVVPPPSTAVPVDRGVPLDIVAVIPARYASTRFPGKPLADIEGRPMIEHVYRRVSSSSRVSKVIVATDDLRIATRVMEFGGQVKLTSMDHQSGTDRLAEVAASLDCDIVVNVQGDEPLIDPRSIDELVAPFADASISMTTLYRRVREQADFTNPNVVKLVLDRAGYAMYFSRAPIPHQRDARSGWPPQFAHVGIYAYRRTALMVLASLEPTPLERAESLEQLRALEHGIRLKALETN